MTTTTTPTLYYVIGAIIVIAVVIAVVLIARRNRSIHLKRRFGPEYDRVTRQYGDQTRAEQKLAEREARVHKLHLQELSTGARDRYSEEWQHVQQRFVDEPKAALTEADALLTNVMRDRGYPVGEFDQRAADLSADHADAVQNYRLAHEISLESQQGTVTTEQLRQAMLHYRALFDDLVGTEKSKA